MQVTDTDQLEKITINIPQQEEIKREQENEFREIKKYFPQLKNIQKHLKKQLSFSSKMNFKGFEEMFEIYQESFKAFYGQKMDCESLFKIFDEDQDSYLNEDEQLNIFTIINSKFMILYQEFIFLGNYTSLRQISLLQQKLLKLITNFQTTLRFNMYEEQLAKFDQVKKSNWEKQREEFKNRNKLFEEFQKLKTEELEMMNTKDYYKTMIKIDQKINQFGFSKYSQLKDMIKQEKFLAIVGNVEEAKNMRKFFTKFYEKENESLIKRKEKFQKTNLNKQDCLDKFKSEMLSQKLDLQKNKMVNQNQKKESYLINKLSAQENIIKKIQHNLDAQANHQFMRLNRINLLRIQSRLKKDFMDYLKEKEEMKYHSFVFQKYMNHQHKNLDSQNQLCLFYRNSEFNLKFNLRNGKEIYEAVNEEFKNTQYSSNNMSRITQIINQQNFSNNNSIKLSHLYDNNLNLKKDFANQFIKLYSITYFFHSQLSQNISTPCESIHEEEFFFYLCISPPFFYSVLPMFLLNYSFIYQKFIEIKLFKQKDLLQAIYYHNQSSRNSHPLFIKHFIVLGNHLSHMKKVLMCQMDSPQNYLKIGSVYFIKEVISSKYFKVYSTIKVDFKKVIAKNLQKNLKYQNYQQLVLEQSTIISSTSSIISITRHFMNSHLFKRIHHLNHYSNLFLVFSLIHQKTIVRKESHLLSFNFLTLHSTSSIKDFRQIKVFNSTILIEIINCSYFKDFIIEEYSIIMEVEIVFNSTKMSEKVMVLGINYFVKVIILIVREQKAIVDYSKVFINSSSGSKNSMKFIRRYFINHLKEVLNQIGQKVNSLHLLKIKFIISVCLFFLQLQVDFVSCCQMEESSTTTIVVGYRVVPNFSTNYQVTDFKDFNFFEEEKPYLIQTNQFAKNSIKYFVKNFIKEFMQVVVLNFITNFTSCYQTNFCFSLQDFKYPKFNLLHCFKKQATKLVSSMAFDQLSFKDYCLVSY